MTMFNEYRLKEWQTTEGPMWGFQIYCSRIADWLDGFYPGRREVFQGVDITFPGPRATYPTAELAREAFRNPRNLFVWA